MKKAVKIPLIVVSSVVGAILVAVIVLCSVTVRPMKGFMDYKAVNVTSSQFGYALPEGSVMRDYKTDIDKSLKKTGFSVMQATLEFVGSYGPKFDTTTDDDGKTVNREITVAQARSECSATSDSYMFELEFPAANNEQDARTYKVGKTEIKYDTVLFNVKSTSSELRWTTVYLYLRNMPTHEGDPASADYRITPVRLRMDTTPLYITLGNVVADPQWGGAN